MQARPAWLILALASGCGGLAKFDPQLVATSFTQTAYCPEARVHVTQLADVTLVPSARIPWHEPELPPEVAGDPERLAVWRAVRDAARQLWDQQQLPPPANVAEVTGCGATHLYSCRYVVLPGIRGASRTCAPLGHDDPRAGVLACRDGRAIRADGAVIACAAERAVDAPACLAACEPDDARCQLGCIASADDQCERNGLAALGACAGYASERHRLEGVVR